MINDHAILHSTNLGAVILSPPERAPVCSGGQLNLTCTTTGDHLEWRFNVILESETTATDISHIFAGSDSVSAATMRLLMVNSTVFRFSRTSARDSLPVESRLLIGPVSDSLNGTVINCDDLQSSQSSSTTIIIEKRDPLPGMHYYYTVTNNIIGCILIIIIYICSTCVQSMYIRTYRRIIAWIHY
jgi:hypothetical protein